MSHQFSLENLVKCAKILDLPKDLSFSEEDVKIRWRKIIERVHPDAGGNNYFSEEANNAKDTLIAWIRANRPRYYGEQNNRTQNGPNESNSQTPNLELIASAIVSVFKSLSTFVKGALTIAFWVVVIGVGIKLIKKSTGPSCEVTNVRSEENVFTTNGQPDYGITSHVDLKNSGAEGMIKVNFRLKTSEGEFYREWRGKMSANEQKTITANFEEPTINNKSTQAFVSCTDE